MSEETKQTLIITTGIITVICAILFAICFDGYIKLEQTKIYLEKGYHLVDGDWLQ